MFILKIIWSDDADGQKKWVSPILGLNPYKMDRYNEIALWHDDSQSAVVVFPLFTATAYANGGFYDYFGGKCDGCTTTTIKDTRITRTLQVEMQSKLLICWVMTLLMTQP